MGLNELDGLIILILLAGLVGGILMRTVRQLMALVIFYVGTIAATQYYHPFGEWLHNLEPMMSPVIRGTTAFIIIAVLSNLVLNLVSYGAVENTDLRSMRALDFVVGGLLGLLSASLWIITITIVMEFWLSVPWTITREPTRFSIIDGFNASALMTFFRQWDEIIRGAVGPFIPDFVPNLFRLK
jgi:uncharacterized membrane protein required for colicin V production